MRFFPRLHHNCFNPRARKERDASKGTSKGAKDGFNPRARKERDKLS